MPYPVQDIAALNNLEIYLMRKNDSSNSSDLLNLNKEIDLLESRKMQLLERKNLCKDKLELKEIEKQLKQVDTLLKKFRNTEAKILKIKAG